MDTSPVASAASSSTTSAFSNLTKNIDTFLTLLTAQLRNQDPLEPLDTEKFTSQLVQFASVEQSIKTNSHLEALIALQSAGDRQTAISLVGRDVEAASDRAALGPDGARWTYTLNRPAASVLLRVTDAAGTEIARLEGKTAEGAHPLAWDGRTAAGARAPDGVYRLSVEALGADGKPAPASVTTQLRVEAAVFGLDGPALDTAAGMVRVADVRRLAAVRE
jgi:flagellar basal-body rod modification protein FlgD